MPLPSQRGLIYLSLSKIRQTGAPDSRIQEILAGWNMARRCEICCKQSEFGNSVDKRGKAKYLGGVGTKITGITRRRFRPNLQNVHVQVPGGGAKTIKACVQCIRSGRVIKAVKAKPFKLPEQK